MAVTGSPFCEHKKLRTGCPACKAGAIPPPSASPLQATPYVSQDDRDKAAEKAADKAARRAASSSGIAGAGRDPREDRAPKEGPRGPGKPLMPTRAKKKGVSADEAAAATAWWVKK